jgi:hypothetical protein
MPTKANVVKVQSYTTGSDASMNVLVDKLSDATKYDKEVIYIYTEEEHKIKQAEIPNLEEYLLNMMEYVKTALLNQQDFETELNKVLEYIRESQQKEGE